MHRSRVLTRADVTHVDHISAVIKPVALVQVAAVHDRDAAAKALDGLLREGARPLWLRGVAERWRGSGVPGPVTVLQLLEERVSGRLPRSWFQRLAKRLLIVHGVQMVDEHAVHDDDGRLLAELDLALPEVKVGVECQSWQWHGTPTARAADARRRRRLRLAGWEIAEVWWTDLDRMEEVADEVALLVARRH